MSLKKQQSYRIWSKDYWFKSILVFLLCIAAAVAGAKIHAVHVQDQINTRISGSAKTQDLSQLYRELGALQGKLLALQARQQSLLDRTGVEQDLDIPQLQSYSVSPKLAATDLPELKHRLGQLADDIALLEDSSDLLSYALSQQSGFYRSLPTFTPVNYPALSSSFGWRKNPVSGRNTMHEGLDFSAPFGAPVYAASGGVIVYAGRLGGYGNLVEIDHGNGIYTRYAHTSKILVKNGDIVQQGQTIAQVGSTGRSTGSHLHFEVRLADYPLDPNLFVNKTLENNQDLAIFNEYFSANKS